MPRGKKKPVESVNEEHDVYFGRGTGSNDHQGNLRFRQIVNENKAQYNFTSNRQQKNLIARQVYDAAIFSGGRFLYKEKDGNCYVEDNVQICVEKCKQALREKRNYTSALWSTRSPVTAITTEAMVAPPAKDARSARRPSSGPVLPKSHVRKMPEKCDSVPQPRWAVTPTAPVKGAVVLPPVKRLHPLLMHPPNPVPAEPMTIIGAAHVPSPSKDAGQPAVASRHQSVSSNIQNQPVVANVNHDKADSSGGGMERPYVDTAASIADNDSAANDEISKSDYLVPDLAVGRSKFTDEQHAAEKASMTDKEKAKVLRDIYGTYRSGHANKKAKRNLDSSEIALLVKQMRTEIEKLPKVETEALMEAQEKCRAPQEFSDCRLEQFLRCEGMNAKLGALRFSNYWHARRSIFGTEKYLLRMTLNEALRYDIVALEACMLCLLPKQDSSGRQILYMDPSRHTEDDYTSDSLLRSIWYVMEVAAQQESTDVSRGVIQILSFKNMSIFDYDPNIYDRIHYFETSCWPFRNCSFHVCCSPESIAPLKSVLFGAMDTASRARMIFHPVSSSESELLSVLAEYGIEKEMLPKDIGGTLKLDQKEWIAKRRAAGRSGARRVTSD